MLLGIIIGCACMFSEAHAEAQSQDFSKTLLKTIECEDGGHIEIYEITFSERPALDRGLSDPYTIHNYSAAYYPSSANDGNHAWSLWFETWFTVYGSHALCTGASHSVTIDESGAYLVSSSQTYHSNWAQATATVHLANGINTTMYLKVTCSPSGVITVEP